MSSAKRYKVIRLHVGMEVFYIDGLKDSEGEYMERSMQYNKGEILDGITADCYDAGSLPHSDETLFYAPISITEIGEEEFNAKHTPAETLPDLIKESLKTGGHL